MITENPLNPPHEAVKLHPVRPGCPAVRSSAFPHRHLLGMRGLDAGAVEEILRVAGLMEERNERDEREGRNGTEALTEPLLPGGVVVTLFYEASTRTRVSFELAASRLGARVVNIAAEASSVTKGECLRDTGETLKALGATTIVIRHPASGAPHLLARDVDIPVVNAGDGAHEHPSQALLDLFTIRRHKGRLSGLKVAVIGDLLHSRVARSNIWGLTTMGAEVFAAGPPALVPSEIKRMGVRVCERVEEALDQADVVYLLRIQLERQKGGLFPSLGEYARRYGAGPGRLALARPDALVMHPGPINRGVEIESAVAVGPRSLITEQVANGVTVRMAILYLLHGGGLPVAAPDQGR